ncbi:MAG: hypothetical protein K0S23_2332 [Fluviicola sp.]|jgi:hypothetical protein|uniref:hypothetical protein n=1 Tax=Fluviicola sp. TaxID=1917219 RepID=UPI00260E7ED5|nr:hypothetical protein [Fluviicola sp.]MDF3028025.1 hypothetical protein [Fluviicola sp.]
MKKVISLISALILTLNLLAQEQLNLVSSSKITTIGYWNKGDKVSYHVTSSDATTKFGAAQPTKQTSNTYDLEITVVDSTEHSYILEMKYLKASVEGVDPQLKEIMNSFQTTSAIRYRTDEFGTFQKILNTAVLQKNFKTKCEEFKKQLTAKLSPEEAKKSTAFLDALLAEFAKPENIEGLYLGDIMAIHGNYGMELNLNKPTDVDVQIPCLMDIVVNGTGKILLQSINKAKDLAIISIKYKPNQEELKKYMKTFFELFVPKDNKDFKIDDMKIDFENTEKLQMYLSSGWMESIQTSRTVSITFEDEKIKKVMTATYQYK